ARRARLHDAREVTAETFGPFDAVVSLGAWEHFASRQDYDSGRQDDVYRRIFRNVASVLPSKGRFFLQTMGVGRNMIDVGRVSRDAGREADAWDRAMSQAAV